MSYDNFDDRESDEESGKSLIDTIVAVVHKKAFPIAIIVIFAIIFFSMTLSGPGRAWVKVLFVVGSLPAFFIGAVQLGIISDAAPSLREAYKRLKKEFPADKNG